ncbi:hypothetical protein TNCV_3835371 [Trichonephila clavipes]|nr:hypothetical protein TNCV_3835371 [Trichonephila clavipes]
MAFSLQLSLEGTCLFDGHLFSRSLAHVGRNALVWKKFWPFGRKKYQGVYSKYRSGSSIYRPSIWFTRCGDIDNISRHSCPGGTNGSLDQNRGHMQTRDPLQSEIIGGSLRRRFGR